MALTFDKLQQLLKGEKLRFLVDPDRPLAQFGASGMFGQYHVAVHLQDEGQFLQFRTMGYLTCPADHAHLVAVLRVLAGENYRRRLVKFGWDASDGEIAAYADVWVMDGDVTQAQFGRMMANFLPCVDEGYHRIKTTLDTGKDPGEDDAINIIATKTGGPGGGGGLPEELRKLLDKLRKAGGGSPTGESGKPIEEI